MNTADIQSDLLVRDSWLTLIEAFALAVLSISALAISRLGDWPWHIPVALAALVLIAGTVHALATWTRLALDADALHIRRAFRSRRVRWDRIRACEYDFEAAKLRLYWQTDGGHARWEDLLRGDPLVRDEVRARAQAEGHLDDLIRLPGPDRSAQTLDLDEMLDRQRQACIDVARDIGREDLANEWIDAPFHDFPSKLNDASPGAGDRAQQLAHDRMWARLPADSVPPPPRHPNSRDAIGSFALGVAATMAAVVATGLVGIDAIAVVLVAVAVAVYHVSPQTRRYLIGSGIVGGLAAGTVAAVQGVDGALIALVVVVGLAVAWSVLVLAAYGEFDGW